MIITIIPPIYGRSITRYCGVVTGEAVIDANIFSGLLAAVRDIVGAGPRPMIIR